ncbi:MAG: hypothetical protein H0T51_04945 [Pirellulales bacterium]|nr:hypothetical protein [Pirellulales bacterium]
MMVAFLIAVATATGVAWCGWRTDVNLTGGPTTGRRALAVALLGASAWLITLILAASWLRVPGAYGPVQYWAGAEGHVGFLYQLRVLAMFQVLGCMLVAAAVGIATIAALLRPGSTPRWQLCVIPALAIGSFAVAYHLSFSREFFPSA